MNLSLKTSFHGRAIALVLNSRRLPATEAICRANFSLSVSWEGLTYSPPIVPVFRLTEGLKFGVYFSKNAPERGEILLETNKMPD